MSSGLADRAAAAAVAAAARSARRSAAADASSSATCTRRVRCSRAKAAHAAASRTAARLRVAASADSDGIAADERRAEARRALLQAVSAARLGGGSGGDAAVLRCVEALEAVGSAEPEPARSPLLSGTWSLLYTASSAGAAAARSGGAAAGAPPVEVVVRDAVQAASDALYRQLLAAAPFLAGGAAAGKRPTADAALVRVAANLQIIDAAAGRVSNVARFSVGPLEVEICVDGTVRAGSSTRTDVTFTGFEVRGPLRLALPLSLLSPRGAIETTYLDDSVRIGRGNLGSVFVVARKGTAAAAAAADDDAGA